MCVDSSNVITGRKLMTKMGKITGSQPVPEKQAKRAVYLLGNIREDSVEEIIEKLEEFAQSPLPVTLYIHSAGGDIEAAEKLAARIRQGKPAVDGLVITACSNEALNVLWACKTRNCVKHARFNLPTGEILNAKQAREQELVTKIVAV
jgi:ATP-dependent protease ClpP protease subunit